MTIKKRKTRLGHTVVSDIDKDEIYTNQERLSQNPQTSKDYWKASENK